MRGRNAIPYHDERVCSIIQEEHEKEEKRLQVIMEENNRKIAEAQQRLVSPPLLITGLHIIIRNSSPEFLPVLQSLTHGHTGWAVVDKIFQNCMHQVLARSRYFTNLVG